MHLLTVLYCSRQRCKTLTTFFLFYLLSDMFLLCFLIVKAPREQGRFCCIKMEM
nr:MAG TPA_asm: hypothetical protein [Bacteriophage sp.]DAU01799.1 MAG TPA: hypothetical protein [Caudoviricetes sp.]